MPKKILLLDPDLNFRSLVNPELEAWGALVTEADNALEARALLRQETFALLIVSEDLEDTSGSQFINHLAAETTAPVAFIYADPLAAEKMSSLLKNRQVVLILQKPLQPVVFSEQIANYLELTYSLPHRQDKSKLPEMLSLLRAAYIKELPQHLEEIAQAVRQAHDSNKIISAGKKEDESENKDKNSSEQFLEEALRKAHRLNGTCGSYGFTSLSEILAAIEKNLVTLQERQQDSLWNELTRQLEAAQLIAIKDREEAKSQVATKQAAGPKQK